MTNQPIELGPADALLAEGRAKAQREQIPFMTALKTVISEKLAEAKAYRAMSPPNEGEGDE